MAEEREKAIKVLRQLRNLLTVDGDLKLPIHDESFLMRFVRSKKYDAELAHQTMKKYYTLKQKNPKIFKHVYPSQEYVKLALESNAVGKLKGTSKDGQTIITWTIGNWNIDAYNSDYFLAAFVLILEETLFTSVDAQINGVVMIIDEEMLGMRHVMECSIKRIQSYLGIFQGSFPLRGKGIHVVKQPVLLNLILAAMTPFMSEKFKERIVLYGQDFPKFHEKFPTEILPENFGGKLSDDEAYDNEFKKNLFKRDEYYKELLDYGYGEWKSEEDDTYM